MPTKLYDTLSAFSGSFHPVVPFDAAKDPLRRLDFTSANTSLTEAILADTEAFSAYVQQLIAGKYTYGVGGYGEHRTLYARSTVFDSEEEPRRLHLGIDIWGPAGTQVYAPLDGHVHSFAFNHHYGDYGATIILQHRVDELIFYTLYGHLALRDIENLEGGRFIKAGVQFAHFGEPHENGHWPPHLHFQIIDNPGDWKGDYPGVCRFSEKEEYLRNSPDPDVILQMMQFAK